MEVSGKKLRKYCKPCEQRKVSKYSDGFCSQCEEEMCQRCFDTHKQWKLFREHRLAASVATESNKGKTPTFDNCTKHLNEPIKFFCPEHGQVGCGDCMVISHKTCKVEYILEHIDGYKDGKQFKMLKKDIETYDNEAKSLLGSIRRNKNHVEDVNKKFALDVKLFRDEIISQITKLADAMLKYGDDIMAADMKKIENLEKENKSLVDETNGMRDTLQSEADQPYKLFISSLSYRQNLHLVRDQLERIKANNTIESYDFMPDCNLEQLMKTCKQLGVLHKPNESGAVFREESIKASKATPVAKALCLPKDQPLLDRQLVCKNLIIDGYFISYAEKAKGDLGLFIDKKTVKLFDSFEIEVMSIGTDGGI
ncbi:E3 ubiquitin-protein ligase TRIM33-like, partial [Ruditapes philippinarum]|uniref:E3 ubiquitin-protein ligase TRIM33-like n=1 Tax=Ruditapes philippinarum TaxID=129788 RepID=UPI00295AF851